MAARCERVRPLLHRFVEREAAPAEAIEVASHLSGCTACKIALAKERRLAALLERDLVDLPVGEEFLRAVMARLPQGPPPRRRRGKRALKLACLSALMGLSGSLAWRQLAPAGADPPALPLPQLEFGPETAVRGLGELLRWTLVAVETLLGRGWPQPLPAVGGVELLAAVAAGALAAAVAGAAVLLLATASVRRPRASVNFLAPSSDRARGGY